jgi:glycosyltransferase involved in cell wall biosynthesis
VPDVLRKPLTVAWISDFPVEWLPEVPEPLRALPRRHPATWQIVLLNELEKELGIKLHVVLFRGRIRKPFSFERNRVVFHILKAPAWLRMASLFTIDSRQIRNLCRTINPDLIHAWGTEKGAGLIAQRLPYPYLMTVQGLLCWYREMVPLTRYEWVIERLERVSLPRAPVVTTESSFAVQYLRKRFPHLCVHQAEHAPNHAFRNVIRKPEMNPIRFISIGTLGFRKGTDMLFKALEQLSSEFRFKMTVVTSSDPGQVASIRATVSPALWERVEFHHGILPHEVARELETPTILLLPTRADTSPNAVKEAVVAGVPVVASSVGGIPDYVFPGQNGFLAPAGDLPAFVQAIRSAANHPLFSKGLVESAVLARTRDYLSPERMATNFRGAYEEALSRTRKK